MSASNLAALIKQAVDIVDVIGQAVPLKRSGNRYYGLCPFHHEKTPSFHVDGENQLYYCFGCGSGGDVLNFVMRHRNLSFMEAVRELAERYQLQLPTMDEKSDSFRDFTEAARKEREELLAVLAAAADFFHARLRHGPEGDAARRYLEQRGVPDHVVEEQALGFSPPDWDALLRHLRGLGIAPELGYKAGLFAKSSKNENHYYDRFRNRLIFPITDGQQRVVAFGGRTLSKDSINEPKYLNSPETPVYHKGRTLYQYAKARTACRETRKVVLVEGYMDLLAFHARGFYSVTANLGTALTVQQVRLLARIADEVILSYDGDEAGERAMLRVLPLFLQESLAVSCVRFPGNMDPDDFLRELGMEGFYGLMGSRLELGAYALGKILDGWDGTSVGKAKVIEEIRPVLDAARPPVLRADYVRLVCERLSIREKVLEHQLDEGKRGQRRFSGGPQPSTYPASVQTRPMDGRESIEEKIVRWMVRYPDLICEVEESGVHDHFEEVKLKNIVTTILNAPHPPSEPFDAQRVHDRLEDAGLQSLFTRFMMEPGEIDEPRIQMRDWLGALAEQRKKQAVSGLKVALEKAMAEGDVVRAKEILAQIQRISSPRKKARGHT